MKVGLYIKNIKVMILLMLQMVLSAFESQPGSLILEWHFRYLGIGTIETLGKWCIDAWLLFLNIRESADFNVSEKFFFFGSFLAFHLAFEFDWM